MTEINGLMDETAQTVAEHYRKNFEYEKNRLTTHSPVEHEITLRYLKEFLTQTNKSESGNNNILIIGCGVGVYEIELAKMGYNLWLMDILDEFLNITKTR